jgi:hypothetical protein
MYVCMYVCMHVRIQSVKDIVVNASSIFASETSELQVIYELAIHTYIHSYIHSYIHTKRIELVLSYIHKLNTYPYIHATYSIFILFSYIHTYIHTESES